MAAPVEIEIGELAPGLNGSKGLMRMHYQTYRKIRDRWTMLVREQVSPPRRLDTCSIEIERCYARHPLDVDNLYSTAKVPLDALKRAGVIRDDDPETVTGLRVVQRKVSKVSDEKTLIRIAA